MKSIVIFITLGLLLNNSYSQDLSKKISERAFMVFSINGARTLEKVTVRELDNSLMFAEIAQEIFRGDKSIQKLDDFGVDYTERIYVVSEFGDDVNYTYLTYKLKDKNTFEKTIKEKIRYSSFEEKEGLNIIEYRYNTKLIWDNETAIFISADYVGEEFADSYWYNDEYETAIYVEENVAIEEMTDEEWRAYMKKEQEKIDEEKLAAEKKEKARKVKRENLEKFVEANILKRSQLFFSDELYKTGKSYKRKLNEDADAGFWYAQNISVMDLLLGGTRHRYGHYSPYNNLGILGNFANFFNGEMNVELFLNETEIKLNAEVSYNDDLQNDYSKIFSQKINKNYTKFVSESDIGFLSVSYSTEEMLNAYPNIIKEAMLKFDTTYQEEYEVLADIFNLVIDEEAIANAITGDAIFILNDLSNKEVEYYSYEYDEEYNYTKTLKTKVELLPDFSVLIGSNEEELVAKVTKLGIKHKIIEPNADGYIFLDKRHDMPFELYFAYKNNIILTTTLKSKMVDFINGTKQNLSSEKSKLISKNSSAFYLDLKTLFGQMMTADLHGSEKRIVAAMENDLTEVFTSMSFKGNSSLISTYTTVPSTEENGASYLLHVIDHFIEAEKSR